MIRYRICAVSALHRGEGRKNVVEDWLDSLGNRRTEVAIELRVLLSYLRELPRDEWEMPTYRQTLQGYPKIGEIRFKLFGTQFRVFGFFGPSSSIYTLLGGATEKKPRYNPANAIENAEKMRERVVRGERTIEEFKVTVAEKAD